MDDALEACKAWLDWAENEHHEGPLMGIARDDPLDPSRWECDVCCATWPKGSPPEHAEDCPVLMAYGAVAKATSSAEAARGADGS
jgi:hypothetical protein